LASADVGLCVVASRAQALGDAILDPPRAPVNRRRQRSPIAVGSRLRGDHRGARTGRACCQDARRAATRAPLHREVPRRASVIQWRDPDSNRGHHDFQAQREKPLTGPKSPQRSWFTASRPGTSKSRKFAGFKVGVKALRSPRVPKGVEQPFELLRNVRERLGCKPFSFPSLGRRVAVPVAIEDAVRSEAERLDHRDHQFPRDRERSLSIRVKSPHAPHRESGTEVRPPSRLRDG
jgi:hypothetical protein